MMASNELKNKITAETGAASGNGAAISKTFAAKGDRLGLIDIDAVSYTHLRAHEKYITISYAVVWV